MSISALTKEASSSENHPISPPRRPAGRVGSVFVWLCQQVPQLWRTRGDPCSALQGAAFACSGRSRSRIANLSGLGFAPEGHKQFEGDGRTPEGTYIVDKRNPESTYHLSVGISYPNEADIAFAEAQGLSPGGDIFIHGGPRPGIDPTDVRDWTAGCIAVTDRQIEEIYAMVKDGTPIDIYA